VWSFTQFRVCVLFNDEGAKAYEKAEDPIYALENNLPIDVQHYLDHQLAQPLMRIFEPVCKDVKAELLSGKHYRSDPVAIQLLSSSCYCMLQWQLCWCTQAP
jgi:DNA polymerase delta subunit 1